MLTNIIVIMEQLIFFMNWYFWQIFSRSGVQSAVGQAYVIPYGMTNKQTNTHRFRRNIHFK